MRKIWLFLSSKTLEIQEQNKITSCKRGPSIHFQLNVLPLCCCCKVLVFVACAINCRPFCTFVDENCWPPVLPPPVPVNAAEMFCEVAAPGSFGRICCVKPAGVCCIVMNWAPESCCCCCCCCSVWVLCRDKLVAPIFVGVDNCCWTEVPKSPITLLCESKEVLKRKKIESS